MNVTFEKKIHVAPRKKVEEKHRRVTVCPSCREVHYKNLWYAPDSRLALLIDEKKDKVLYHTCPACEMQKEGLYEGVLYIRNIPSRLYNQVISAVLHEAVRDYTENPQHRLLDFYDIEGGYKVTASSAAMVHRIGKKLKAEFDSCEMHSAYQHEPYPLQVTKLVFVDSAYF